LADHLFNEALYFVLISLVADSLMLRNGQFLAAANRLPKCKARLRQKK